MAAFSVDENGIITGNITGTVNGSGNITWDSNATGFTTGTISGGVLAATTSQNNNGAISTSRIAANNNAGGFGGSGSVAQSLVARAPTPNGANMLGVTYGGNKFVAVGPGGNVIISSNGTNWISANAATSVQLNAVAYGNSVYVAVGDGKTVMTSPDAITWTPRSLNGDIVAHNVVGVAFGGGKFVAVNLINDYYTSTDGISWTKIVSPPAVSVPYNIKYVGSRFVVVGGNGGTGTISTSTDGVSWGAVKSIASSGAILDVAYGNSKWVGVNTAKAIVFTTTTASDATATSVSGLGDSIGFVNGLFVSDKCNYSADGVTWNRDTYPDIDINDFVTANNVLVAVGAAISTSVDGKMWTVHTKVLPEPDVNNYSVLNNAMTGDYFDEMLYYNYLGAQRYTRVGLNGRIEEKALVGGTYTNAPSPTTENLRAAVGYVSSAALIVGDHGTILKYGYSAAVNKFTNVVSGTTANLRSITTAGNVSYVAVGEGGTILYSSNYGTSWSGASSGTSANLNRVAYFGSPFSYYIAVGDSGKILKSSNGTSWTTLTSGTTKRLVGIGNSGSNRLVAMAEDSTAIISDDHGVTWRSQPINAPFAITYATATLARGVGGFQMTSSNGTNWTYTLPNFGGVSALARGNGRTIALGNNYAVSTDLDNWTGAAMRYPHQAITFGKGLFVSAGTGDNTTGFGNIATSVDGSQWISRSTPIATLFNAIAYGAGKFVAVGQIGKIVSSSDTVTWTDRTISGSQDLYAITYGGGKFVAVGSSSAVRLSTDGDTWTSASISGTMRSITYGNGLFVAVGDTGNIRTSPDGTSWTTRTSGTSQGLKSISYTGSLFIAVGNQDGSGNGAVVVSSTDGITWTKANAFFANGLLASTAGSGYFVTGGANGTILAAPYQDTTSPVITSQPTPTSQTVSAGANVSYSVGGTGSGLFYQWFKDGTPLTDGNGIAGATTATLTLTGVDVLDTGVYRVAVYNNSGSDLSQALSLNVNGPPIITIHPVSIITSNTYTTNFSVVAVGPGTLTYQWRKNTTPLTDVGHYSGTATDRLLITGATGADEGTYDVIVSNSFGSSSPSTGATLTVNRPPTITTPPVATNIKETQTINLSVVADGSPTLTYVWKRNGVTLNDGGRISGATTANLVITGAIVADGGGYTVTVANSYNPAATSVSAYVNVLGPGAFNPAFIFNGNGVGSGPGVYDIAATSDGRFVVGGDFSIASGLTWSRLAKIDVNGAPTANFATTNGASTANNTIRTVALQPDGQIVTGGSFWQWGGSTTYGYTVRLSADGVLDTTYLPATAMTVQTIIPRAGNKMLVARTLLGFATSYVTRYNADGSKDNTFTEIVNANGQINNMALQSDGTIWMAGLFGLKKANADGTNPTSVTTYASFSEMGFVNVGPDDKIYYSDNNGIYFGRLNADGSRDTTFTVDSNINGHVIDMAFLPNGNMVIVGSFQTVQSTTTAYIAVLDNTGALVNGFISPFTWVSGGSIRTIQMLDDGSALLGGSAQVTLPSVQKYLHRVQIYKSDLYVATHPVSQTVNRFDPVTFTALGEGTSTVSYQWRKNGDDIPGATSSSYSINNATEANQGTYDVVITNLSGNRTSRAAELTVLGDVFISGQPVSLVVTQYLSATFSVTATGAIPITYQWRKNGQNIPNATSSSYTISSAKVGDAANYDVVVSNPLGNQPSALVALSVVGSGAAAGTPGTLDTSFTAATLNSSSVYGVNVDAQGRVYVTGGFTTYNSQTRDRFMRLNADLTLDASFAPSFNNITFATRFLPDGGFLIGGQFNSLNSATKYGIARFNSADELQTDPTLSNFGTVGDGNAPNGITVNEDGSYFIAGSFTTVNTTTRPYIAKINADHTLNTTFAPSAYPYTQGGSMRSIAVAADGSVIATGKIVSTFASGDTHVGIVRYLANGTVDTSYNTQIDSNSNGPLEIGYQSSGKAIIIGTFSTLKDNPAAGAQTRYGIARLNTDGTVDTGFNANLNISGQVYDMIIQPDDKIIIVGSFTSVNSTSRGRIARLNADGTLDTTFATGTGANSSVYSIAQLPTGGYMLGGQFSSYDGDSTKRYLTKIHGTPPTPPTLGIIKQPLSQSVLEGEGVDFTVAAVGKAPMTFVWKKGTEVIPDANNPSYHISSVTMDNAGDYTVVVTDADNNVTSNIATLTVTAGATFAAWSADKGLTPGLNDGYNDDADGDGVKNVVEYVFNTHPNQGGSKPVIEKIKQNVTGTDYPAVRVIALKDLQDIDVVVEASTSATFNSIIPTITTVVDQGNGTQQITIRTTTPFSSTTTVFFRFIIRGVVIEG